jgi:hypothetical protein
VAARGQSYSCGEWQTYFRTGGPASGEKEPAASADQPAPSIQAAGTEAAVGDGLGASQAQQQATAGRLGLGGQIRQAFGDRVQAAGR